MRELRTDRTGGKAHLYEMAIASSALTAGERAAGRGTRYAGVEHSTQLPTLEPGRFRWQYGHTRDWHRLFG